MKKYRIYIEKKFIKNIGHRPFPGKECTISRQDQLLKNSPTDIIAIQEIWQRQYNLLQIGKGIDITDRAYKRGDGTAYMQGYIQPANLK